MLPSRFVEHAYTAQDGNRKRHPRMPIGRWARSHIAPCSTARSPARTFVTHYGQQVHFDGAKDEDAVLLIVGLGPATATPAEAK
jgi:hypothetical protein